jgi:hypothetical protein
MLRFLRLLAAGGLAVSSGVAGIACEKPAPAAETASGTGGGEDGGTQPQLPSDVPALTILAPEDAPARPAVDASCPIAAPTATVHYPGPCTILEFQPATKETYRTQRRWAASVRVAETTGYWTADFPGGAYSQFDRSSIAWTLTVDGRPLRAVALDQSIYGTTPGGRSATAGFTDFTYDTAGRLVGSDNTYWARTPGYPFDRLDYKDGYLVDAVGRSFLVTREPHGWGGITPALDRGFLFTPLPVIDQPHSVSSSLHPNGVVSSYSTTLSRASGTDTRVQRYDEHGTLLQDQLVSTDRFGQTTTYSSTYNYEGGRIASVDTAPTVNWKGAPPGHTDYQYDARGNNVERTTTDASGDVHYLAVYDTANNLVCEQSTATRSDDFAHTYVRHYDYGCF